MEPTDSPPPSPAHVANDSRRRWLYAAVALGGTALGTGLAWWRIHNAGANRLPDQVWRQKLVTPAGTELSLTSFQGKPLVLNFWATWCPPCIEEFPLLDDFYRQNSLKSWNVVGLAVDRAEAVRRFLSLHPVAFPIAVVGDEGLQVGELLGDISQGLPFTVVIGKDGYILQRKMGRLSAAEIAAWTQLDAG